MTITTQENPQWKGAQKAEKDFWDGIALEDHAILRILADNAERAPLVRKCFSRTPEASLEVGIGPFGLGISGFLPEIPARFAIDPLPPVLLEPPAESNLTSSMPLRIYIQRQRTAIWYIVGRGEEIPIRSESMDLIICSNVIDHTSDPGAVLREIHRVLKSTGLFFIDVDTFFVLGLAKWHPWTKHIHRNQVLVKAHPYRMYEFDIVRKLRSCGFQLQKLHGHTRTSNLIGHAHNSTYLGVKCAP